MGSEFRPGTAAAASTSVELRVSALGLLDMDVLSKSDPFCVLSRRDVVTGQLTVSHTELARTETIDNNLNPEWVTPFHLEYFFEEQQLLRFHVYDADSKDKDLAKHDFLGQIDCSLGEIVADAKFKRPLKGPKPNAGSLSIHYLEVGGTKEEITLQFRGEKLDRKTLLGAPDALLAIYRTNADGGRTVVHRTDVVRNERDPKWKAFTLPRRTLAESDKTPILIKCLNWHANGREEVIGEVKTTLAQLLEAKANAAFELVGRETTSCCRKAKTSGTFRLVRAEKTTLHSFLDFIGAGTQLACTIAIDFTASNGDPSLPSSLHCRDSAAPNHYVQALKAVGEIIQDYDSDKLFPVLGFGARLPPDGVISHNFPVNGRASNPYCAGIPDVVREYSACLSRVQLSGPTNFAPVITHVAKQAAERRDGSEYFILLLITDGAITDMPQTKNAIVDAACLPLSIIIVGVGLASFEAMDELDGDDDGKFGRLRSTDGVPASRDIVQFVPFRKFVGGEARATQARLAKEVLAEIPTQFLSFMKDNHISPGAWPKPKVTAPPLAPPPLRPQSAVAVTESDSSKSETSKQI